MNKTLGSSFLNKPKFLEKLTDLPSHIKLNWEPNLHTGTFDCTYWVEKCEVIFKKFFKDLESARFQRSTL